MKILVTGGAGFIGSHVCESLLEKGYEVLVIDDLSTGKLINIASIKKKIKFYHSRVEEFDFNQIDGIDSVIHLAAQASVPLSISDFYNSSKTNILSSLRVIDFCSKFNLPLVYASSSAIYGSLSLGNDEESIIDLISPYAADKLALELYANVASRNHGLSSIGLRFFNVYGPRQDPLSPYSGVISIFIDRLLLNQDITINGGAQTRDFIYVTDVVDVIIRALEVASSTKISESVNVLTGSSVSINNLANNLIKMTNSKSSKVYNDLAVGDPEESNGTSVKLKGLLNFIASDFLSLQEGLNLTISDIKNEMKD